MQQATIFLLSSRESISSSQTWTFAVNESDQEVGSFGWAGKKSRRLQKVTRDDANNFTPRCFAMDSTTTINLLNKNKSVPSYQAWKISLLHVNKVVVRWVSFYQKGNTARSKFTRRCSSFTRYRQSLDVTILSNFIERQKEVATTTKLEYGLLFIYRMMVEALTLTEKIHATLQNHDVSQQFYMCHGANRLKKEVTMSFI